MYILVKCYIGFCTLTRTKMDSKKKKKKKRLYLYMEVAKLGNAISPKVITTKFPLDNLIYSLKPSFCQEDFIF